MKTQMQNTMGTSFSGAKLGAKPSLAGSSMRFRAQFRPAGARRSAMNIRAEKVGGIFHSMKIILECASNFQQST
jgi:hypothetical protein